MKAFMTIRDAGMTAVSHAVVAELIAAHTDAVRPMTLRRRSLTSAMTAALLASWSVVEERIDDHVLLAMTLLRASPEDGTHGTEFDGILARVTAWLEKFGTVQAVTWQTPPPLMARTLLATFHGLILDFAATRDSDGARQLIGLLGYHLAQSGLRHTKVPPRGVVDDEDLPVVEVTDPRPARPEWARTRPPR